MNKPENVTCPVCQETYEYFLDADGDWDIDAEWWTLPTIPFLDSRYCWLQASGYHFDKTQGRWVK
jgi:hypothetical protein